VYVGGLYGKNAGITTLAVAIGMSPKGEAVLLKYRAFIQTVVDFLIVAVVIIIAIKGINRLKKPAAAAAAPPPCRQEALLEDIRNLLAKRP
jgi:large conductance mechanosensitive channel